MILLRVVNQFPLGSVLRPDQHIVLQEPVGGLPALFLVEGGLGSAELFQFVLALLYQPLIILQQLLLILILRGLLGALLLLGLGVGWVGGCSNRGGW